LQQEAARAVRALLQDGLGASRLLRVPGAMPRLLQHAGRSSAPDQELLQLLLAAAQWPTVASELGHHLELPDAEVLVGLLGPGQTPGAQRLSRAYLQACLQGSAGNRVTLAAVGINSSLAGVAMDEVEGSSDSAVLSQLVTLMQAMLEPAAAEQEDSAGVTADLAFAAELAVTDADVAGFVRPALYIAADAAVEGNVPLATSAMKVLAR
jgi:hypothetical protein